MKLEKLFLPLSVFAAVITVYLLFKGQQSTAAVTPNTASSGVPVAYTLGGVVQPATYSTSQVSVPAQASTDQVSANPGSNSPAGGGVNYPPAYLTQNFGPGSDLTKPQGGNVSSGGCGCHKKSSCGPGCKQPSSFTDGSSPTPLAANKTQQINSNADLLAAFGDNINQFFSRESSQPIPSLTSQQPSAELSSAPTNGTPWQWVM